MSSLGENGLRCMGTSSTKIQWMLHAPALIVRVVGVWLSAMAATFKSPMFFDANKCFCCKTSRRKGMSARPMAR